MFDDDRCSVCNGYLKLTESIYVVDDDDVLYCADCYRDIIAKTTAINAPLFTWLEGRERAD